MTDQDQENVDEIEQVPRGPKTPTINDKDLPKIYPRIKRVLELPVALVLVLCLLPFYIGITLFAYVSHGYPALFRFPRLGKNSKPFSIFKFRTMDRNAKQKMREGASNESLITGFGHFLRRTHLDEIAQAINVLFGHISFVGPRPMDSDTFNFILEENEIWPDILKTRPGITCLESILADIPEIDEQVRRILKIPAPPETPPTISLPRRYPLDRFYIENESLWMDIVIVWYTLRTFAGKAAPHR
jgi:lipopolysaccharide/colanic/teichoic acid biosynthesis glycosyltransferase